MSQIHRALSERWRAELERLCAVQGITLEDAQSKLKFKMHHAARKDCYAYLKAEGWSYPEIGGLFSRDHTTILYSMITDEERRALKRKRANAYYHRMGARRVA